MNISRTWVGSRNTCMRAEWLRLLASRCENEFWSKTEVVSCSGDADTKSRSLQCLNLPQCGTIFQALWPCYNTQLHHLRKAMVFQAREIKTSNRVILVVFIHRLMQLVQQQSYVFLRVFCLQGCLKDTVLSLPVSLWNPPMQGHATMRSLFRENSASCSFELSRWPRKTTFCRYPSRLPANQIISLLFVLDLFTIMSISLEVTMV